MPKSRDRRTSKRELSISEIERVEEIGKIPIAQRERFRFWFLQTLKNFDLAKEGYAQVPTRRKSIKHLHNTEKTAKKLRILLREPWMQGHMIAFEQGSILAKPNARSEHIELGFQAVEKRVRRDLKAIDQLLDRLSIMIAQAEQKPKSKDENTAARGAAKPHLDLLAQWVLSYWSKKLKRNLSLHESSDLITFAAVVRQVAEEDSSDISLSTIRSWLAKNLSVSISGEDDPTGSEPPVVQKPVASHSSASWKRAYTQHLESLGMDHASAAEMANAIKDPDVTSDPVLAARRDFEAI